VLAENSVVAHRTRAVVREFAIVIDGEFNPVTMRAAYAGMNSTLVLLQAGDGAIVEIGLAARKRLRVGQRLDFGKSENLGELC